MKIRAAFIALTLFFSLSGAHAQQVFDTIESSKESTQPTPLLDPTLSIFSQLMVDAGIGDLFKGTGPFTGFIPTNEAFEKLGEHKLAELKKPENRDQLADLLMYHIVPGKYLAKNLKNDRLRTINGNYLNIDVQNGEIKVNGAKVVKTDVIGPNGAIQEINAVLFP